MADIFLSYAREDWERIRPLAQSLEALGWSVWWDTRMRAGLHFDEMIEAELARAPCVMVVWTEASIGSHWVRAEAAEALEQHKLIPLFLDKVKAPLLFRHVQGLDLKGWDGSPDHPVFRRLVEDASQLAGPPAPPVAEPAPLRSGAEAGGRSVRAAPAPLRSREAPNVSRARDGADRAGDLPDGQRRGRGI